ncbi:hypothetical protein DL765_005008 [Monosporascus sp. GIB2]|nr:hypothetical protein DL765_005008 [Monosporascus sp. GIB2]
MGERSPLSMITEEPAEGSSSRAMPAGSEKSNKTSFQAETKGNLQPPESGDCAPAPIFLVNRESRAAAFGYPFTRFQATRSFRARRLSTEKKMGSEPSRLPRRRPGRRRSRRRRDSGHEQAARSYDGSSSRVTLANSEKFIRTASAVFLSTAPLLSLELSCHPDVVAANQETKGKLQLPKSKSVLSFPHKNRWSTIRPEAALRNHLVLSSFHPVCICMTFREQFEGGEGGGANY